MADRAGALAFDAGSNGVPSPPRDAHAQNIYATERRSLTFREALEVLLRGSRFFAAHRRLVAFKAAIAISSMLLFLITPWPMKIIIDNVIDAHPLTGLPARILLPLVGTDRMALLKLIVISLLVTVILCGISGDDPQRVDTEVGSDGLDQAGAGGSAANNGWSLWNGLLGIIETYLTLDLTQRVNQDLRTTIFTRLLRSPLGLFGDQKIGDAVFRVMNDSSGIGEVFYRGLLAPVMSLTMFACALILITAEFSNEPMIPIGAALMLPLLLIAGALFSQIFRDRAQTMRERGSDIMAAFEERLANIHLIKAYGAEARETHNVDAASWESYRATLKLIGFAAAMVLMLVPPVLFLAIFGLHHLFAEVIDQRLSLGDVVLLLSYTAMLGRPMAELGATWVNLQEPIAGLRRAFSVLDRLEEDRLGSNAIDPGKITGIEMRNVSIAYEGAPPVVRDISFELRAGELTALAGPSGTGKTTIISALPRFIEACAGEILINGIELRRVALETLRTKIGFVFQQEALFSRSLADNIRYGVPAATDEEIRAAARLAGCAEFIEALPEKYLSMLGRRGARLSVGQKQRLAIARALMRNPEVLILDEPTAPLDPASEGDLMDTLRALARSRIVLIAAHRVSTLAICDRILFVSGGSLIAAGSHEELRRDCRQYREYLSLAESDPATPE